MHLVSELVVWRGAELDLRYFEMWGVIDHSKRLQAMGTRVGNGRCAGFDGWLGLSSKGLAVPVLQVLDIGESLTWSEIGT